MDDVENKIPAAIAIVADKGAARGHARDHRNQTCINPICLEPVQDDPAKSVIAYSACKDAAPAAAGCLIDENARGSTGVGPAIGTYPAMVAAQAGANKFNEELAYRCNSSARGHCLIFPNSRLFRLWSNWKLASIAFFTLVNFY